VNTFGKTTIKSLLFLFPPLGGGQEGPNKIILGKVVKARKAIKKIKAYGQLVLLDFTVTSFTSVAYQRYRL
jgi:hypothetical protein